ncbi:MAG: sodium:proton exchanger [Chitinivibrionales bacterium]|nr:sodium:proton exchanger [Chitinivibrionales bacterium]MBD3396512.1 sodium:proton exchanger [Chitinivibrionales bacterium]
MNSVLLVGLVLSAGFLLGEMARLVKLPKVTGYILGGIALNPTVTRIVPASFVRHTDLTIDVALSVIAFSVGGALSYSRLKKLGASVLLITLFEAETALLLTATGFVLLLSFFPQPGFTGFLQTVVPFSILLGTFACPTDPSATLAVTHEYRAKGRTSSTILSVAGLDDVMGLTNFTLATTAAAVLIHHTSGKLFASLIHVIYSLGGAAITGCAFAALMILEDRIFKREGEGAHIVIVLSLLAACYGISAAFNFDSLLACMVMGACITNFSRLSDSAFGLLERYTDELVFVLFFTLSAMQLDFTVLKGVLPLIGAFIVLRFAGKISGTLLAGKLAKYPIRQSFHIGLGFIPQGGIVIGLALVAGHDPTFKPFGQTIISIVIGSTISHEIVGPILATTGLRAEGELQE